jgi:hypothetical protein
LHSPSSERHKLTQKMKSDILRTLLHRVPPPFIIGGDLNMGYISMSLIASDLERAQKSQEKHHIVSSLEHGAFHGDLALVRGMRTEHEDTLIGHRFKPAASDAHDVVIVNAFLPISRAASSQSPQPVLNKQQAALPPRQLEAGNPARTPPSTSSGTFGAGKHALPTPAAAETQPSPLRNCVMLENSCLHRYRLQLRLRKHQGAQLLNARSKIRRNHLFLGSPRTENLLLRLRKHQGAQLARLRQCNGHVMLQNSHNWRTQATRKERLQ